MEISNKIDAYNSLVEKVKKFNKVKLKEMNLVSCEESDEVNFWAYWQGGREHLDAEILLVGQDWGSINYDDEPVADIVVHHPEKLVDFCYMKNNENLTNQHICELITGIYPDVNLMEDTNTQRQIFFTNFVPWYRLPNAPISGGFDKRWIEPSTEIFLELVSIIKPKVVMCLGQKTYNSICDAMNIKAAKRGKNYSTVIESGGHDAIVNGTKTTVVPLMHPGFWGTRAKSSEKQFDDWKKVRKYL